MLPMDFGKPGDGPRDRHTQHAINARVAIAASSRDAIHVAGGRERRALSEIERAGFP